MNKHFTSNKGRDLSERVIGDIVITLYQGAIPNKVTFRGKQIWWFADTNFRNTKNEIHEINGEPVIIRIARNEIVEIVILKDLGSRVTIKVAGVMKLVGGYPAEKTLSIKEELSKKIGMSVPLSDEEKIILKKREQKVTAEVIRIRDLQNAEDRMKYERTEKKRQEVLAEITSRKTIKVWTTKGPRYGLPVTDGEWQKLNEKFAVLMVNGKAMETFIVAKDGAKPYKKLPADVIEKPEENKNIEAERMISVTIGNEKNDAVIVFKDMNGVREAQNAGLNGGTWVAIPDVRHPKKRFQILAVFHNKIDTLKVVECKPN